MVRVRAIVRRRKYFSIAPDEIAAQGAARCTHTINHPHHNSPDPDHPSTSRHQQASSCKPAASFLHTPPAHVSKLILIVSFSTCATWRRNFFLNLKSAHSAGSAGRGIRRLLDGLEELHRILLLRSLGGSLGGSSTFERLRGRGPR